MNLLTDKFLMKIPAMLLMTFMFSITSFGAELAHTKIEPHPYLSPVNSIHLNHFNTATTDMDAPTHLKRIKKTRINYGWSEMFNRWGINLCLNFLSDHEGNLYGFCGSPNMAFIKGLEFHLAVFDPKTMEKKAKYTFFEISLQNIIKNKLPMNLGYFMMDSQGRVIVTTAEGEILFLKKNKDENKIELVDKKVLPEDVRAKGLLSQVMPDYLGNYWFFMPGERDKNHAQVGYLNSKTEEISMLELEGELIENGLSIESSGVYVVSDKSLYKLKHTDHGIEIIFQESYETASSIKPGTISFSGSGTTPTLHEDDLLTMVDNADDQVNLLVFNRKNEGRVNGRLICKVPLFEKGKSSVENTVVAHHNSIVVQNWHKAPAFMGSLREMEPGIWRIDVREDRSGCDIIWKNNTSFGTSTLKLSTQTGLLYLATQNRKKLVREKSYIEFIDFQTGEVVKKQYVGRGLATRFMMSPIYIVPGGKIIQPIYSGIVTLENK